MMSKYGVFLVGWGASVLLIGLAVAQLTIPAGARTLPQAFDPQTRALMHTSVPALTGWCVLVFAVANLPAVIAASFALDAFSFSGAVPRSILNIVLYLAFSCLWWIILQAAATRVYGHIRKKAECR